MSDNLLQELKIRAQLDPVVRRKLAAYPLQFLANFDLSFDYIRKLRPGSVETEEQEEAIYEYEHALDMLMDMG
jgi:hypothetical protein